MKKFQHVITAKNFSILFILLIGGFAAYFIIGSALPTKAVTIRECKQPEACTAVCTRQNGGISSGDKYNMCTYVNCADDGYWVGEGMMYKWCLDGQLKDMAAQLEEEARLKREADLKLLEVEQQADAERKQLENTKKLEESQEKERLAKLGIKIVAFGNGPEDIKVGDTITSGKKETTIMALPDGSRITLNKGASLKVEDQNTFNAQKGSFHFIFKKIDEIAANRYRIRVSGGAIGIRGTELLVDVTAAKATIKMLSGEVEISDTKEKLRMPVLSGYQVDINKNGTMKKPRAFRQSKADRWFEKAEAEMKTK